MQLFNACLGEMHHLHRMRALFTVITLLFTARVAANQVSISIETSISTTTGVDVVEEPAVDSSTAAQSPIVTAVLYEAPLHVIKISNRCTQSLHVGILTAATVPQPHPEG